MYWCRCVGVGVGVDVLVFDVLLSRCRVDLLLSRCVVVSRYEVYESKYTRIN